MWSLELFRTVDGLRYGELPSAGFSWSRELRKGSLDAPPQGLGTERASGLEWSVASLEAAGWIDRTETGWQERLVALLMPKKHGIMALWDGVPMAGGPISGTVNFEADTVSLAVDDIATGILGSRFVVSENFSPKTQIKKSGVSLGGLAVEALRESMRKPSGSLPLELPATEPGEESEAWKGYAVANLDVAGLLEDYADRGPDIDFRAKVLDDTHFVWEVVHGTSRELYLGQSTVHDWEQGSQDVVSVTAKLSTEYVAHRVYAVGGGQDVATPIVRRDIEVPQDWPLIEATVSDSKITAATSGKDANAAAVAKQLADAQRKLEQLGDAYLSPYPMLQVEMTVRADGSNPLGTFWPGEVAHVTLHDLPCLSAGTYDLRILSMSGSDGQDVTLVFDAIQPERY